MLKITKTGIAYIFIAIIFVIFQIFINQRKIETNTNQDIMVKETQKIQEISQETGLEVNLENQKWKIEITKISLQAEISEGTTKETLNKYIGHFENTQKEDGNIGLAAHNRGYDVNYFKDLKLLEKGDEIKYIYNQYEKIYEVEKNRIIKDTEWEYLENTEDNRITLITCVENQPEYRRCVQAVEKEEDKY